MNTDKTPLEAESQPSCLGDVRRSYSKSYPKGLEITDDALIFINDTLQAMTVMNENGHREFKAKVRITFNYA